MRLAVGLLCALMTLACACHSAGNDLLWQVGTPDDSYAEFRFAGRIEAYKQAKPGGATFEVGKGDSAKNWLYIQPGPEDKEWAGEGEHPYEVIFNLDAVPRGPFILRIDLVDVSPSSATTLRVRVNDHVRSFDLEPGASDASLVDAAKGRKQVIELPVAAGFLHGGRNVVNLVVTRGSWVLYDCVSMTACESAPKLIDGLSLRPTYLFKKRGGELKQIVHASMDLYQDQESFRVEITSEAGWRAERVLDRLGSGHCNLEVEVPPVAAAQKAHLKVSAGGQVFETDGTVVPQRRWRIYLLPSSHFDYGYTSIQDKAMKLHRENVERAIDWCGEYPGFKWDLEASFIARDYLENGSRPRDFLRLAQAGRIGVMGFFANELTGNCSGEGLSRLVDYYDFLRRRHGIESKCAMQNDVPTMVATVPMVLAGHGIKYLSHGTNTTRTGRGQEMNRYPYYWESPDGSRVLVWKVVGCYAQSAEITGLDDAGHMGLAMDRINSLLDEYVRRGDYPFDALLLHSAYGDNWPSGISLAAVPDEWNRTYEYPKIIFSNGPEFFEYIEGNFAEHIGTVRGDGGVWWEDGVGSSARETAANRAAERTLVTAEKLTALCGKAFEEQVRPEFDEAWKNVLLYDEHTWGAADSMTNPYAKSVLDQWMVKKGFADKAEAASRKLVDRAMQSLCSRLAARRDAVVVYNPSSWARSEWVSVRTANGRNVSVHADSVPPLGYKVVSIDKAAGAEPRPAAGETLDNRYYTIRFDANTGAVTGIYDKELKRELVDPSAWGANCYLYVSGGENSALLGYGPEKPDIEIGTPSGAAFQRLVMPGRQAMKIRSGAPNANGLVSEVVLYDDQKRIDFTNEIDKIKTVKKEAGYFAFPFAFKNPKVRLEIPGGVIRPELDQFPGACKDWYAVQQFITVADDEAAVAWTAMDSPLITLQDINRGQWYDHLQIENGSVFAYVFNNYWWTNYKASQGGEHTFRFSITSARSISDIQAKRFGESVQSPMVARFVKGKPGAKTASSKSFVRVHGEGVVVQAMKPARFSDGTVIRLREMSGKRAKVKLAVSGIGFKRAYLCNLAEDKLSALVAKDGAIDVPCRALGLATVLLER